MTDSFSADSNYTHSRVPENQTVQGWHIALVLTGITITLPAFLVGAEIMTALGTVNGMIAIFIGGSILGALGVINMSLAARLRMSTYQILAFAFGDLGSRMVSGFIAFTLLGWFGVTASLFGRALAPAIKEIFDLSLSPAVLSLAGSALMTVITIFGFRAMDLLSRLTVPFMLFILGLGLYNVLSAAGEMPMMALDGRPSAQISGLGAGISLMVGSFMVGLTVVPDVARFLRRRRDAVPASLLSYVLAAPLILSGAGLPALISGDSDLITLMYKSGLGLPALFVMVFATLTTNISNLYSSSLGMAQLFPRAASWKITVGAGAIGGLMAVAGIMEHLVSFLVFLSVAVPPIAGIYVTDFMMNAAPHKKTPLPGISLRAMLVWVLAVGLAYAGSLTGLSPTGIAACDSVIVAVLAYVVGHKWSRVNCE
mgnify:CR=1 FL=1|tara:strand:+ start:2935 stop:4212 length:1278 start_codon:yes stop_codon:yes gene_type:complete